ncbi:ester cyclase [Bosea sp. CCNWLY174]|uniref:ester cyclase n=1 Tax=unclassified Bosea (in: a-proteobacteria) TaxID=2653178 RepID=UPI003FA54654
MGPTDGREEYKSIVTAFVSAFPAESPVEIIDQFVSQDGTRVVTRLHSRPRHAGEFSASPPRTVSSCLMRRTLPGSPTE